MFEVFGAVDGEGRTDYLRGMKTVAEIIAGVAIGVIAFAAALCLTGCAVSPCVHALGACGHTTIFYDECRHRVVIGSPDGAFVEEPKAEKPVFDPTTPEPGRWRATPLKPRLMQECSR